MEGGSCLGAAGVPFGAAKIEEFQVCVLFAEGVGVDAKCHFGVLVAEL